MVLVVSSAGRLPAQVRTAADVAADEARANHAQVLADVANRVAVPALEATTHALSRLLGDVTAYAIPSEPVLDSPTVRELMTAVHGT